MVNFFVDGDVALATMPNMTATLTRGFDGGFVVVMSSRCHHLNTNTDFLSSSASAREGGRGLCCLSVTPVHIHRVPRVLLRVVAVDLNEHVQVLALQLGSSVALTTLF